MHALFMEAKPEPLAACGDPQMPVVRRGPRLPPVRVSGRWGAFGRPAAPVCLDRDRLDKPGRAAELDARHLMTLAAIPKPARRGVVSAHVHGNLDRRDIDSTADVPRRLLEGHL